MVVPFVRSVVVFSMVMTQMTTITAMAVPSSRSLQASHEKEPGKNSNRSNKTTHPVTGELVTRQHLIEGDVEKGPCSEALKHSDGEDMGSAGLVHMDGDDDADENAKRGHDAQN